MNQFPGRLDGNPLVQYFVQLGAAQQKLAPFAGLPPGTQRGTVVDVDDPLYRGRVRVTFDAMNKDIPQSEFTSKEFSSERQGETQPPSHWIDVSPAFKGRHPKGLIGARVNIVTTNGEYQYAILQDVLYDPELLTEKAGSKLKIPQTSTMTRLPVYDAGELPPPCAENHGCTVVESGGPMDSDWMCVCLKRDGQYFWVRHSDLAHIHAGGNDCHQQVDSTGCRQNPIMMGTVGDSVSPTTHMQFNQKSAYTTKPQGNPKGQKTHWYPAPGSGQEYKPGENFSLINPDPDTALEEVRKIAGFPDFNVSLAGFKLPTGAPVPTILQTDAQNFLKKAQDVLKATELAKKVIANPTGAAVEVATNFVKKESLSLANSAVAGIGIPPGTEAALGALKNPQGFLSSTIKAVAQPILGGVTSAVKKILGLP